MSGSPLQAVRRFVVPMTLLQETLDVLQAAGRDGHEAFVLWAGTVRGGEGSKTSTLTFTRAVVPAQTPHVRPEGLLVTVEGQALFDVNRDMYTRGELLAGQVHSHPTDAYHSDVDDHFPLVTMLGALSLVVPNFARDGHHAVAEWAWYRLTGQGRWAELTRSDSVELRHDL